MNLFIKLSATIKLGDYTRAYKILEEEVLKSAAIKRQSKNIEFVLRKNLTVDSKYHSDTREVK